MSFASDALKLFAHAGLVAEAPGPAAPIAPKRYKKHVRFEGGKATVLAAYELGRARMGLPPVADAGIYASAMPYLFGDDDS